MDPLPFFAQVTLRGGISGSATNAAPVSPKSARQIAFHVACARSAGLPLNSDAMLSQIALTIDSIM